LLPGDLLLQEHICCQVLFGNPALVIACWRSTKLAVNKTLRSTAHLKIQRIQRRFWQMEESGGAEAESPDRLLPSLIRCW
jgi:hypothetical protein